jgi:hypothetical protein
MEVRHTFSEPRLAVNCEKLTWNVDVYREGVENPVGTLVINEATMPPRIRKKKVVWKLPDSNQSLPKFGVEEKKRLLEIFKLQKKDRRKSAKRPNGSGSGGDDETTTDNLSLGGNRKEQENPTSISASGMKNGALVPSNPPEKETKFGENHVLTPSQTALMSSTSVEIESSIPSDPRSPSSSCPPPGFSQSIYPTTIPRYFRVDDNSHEGIAISLAQSFIEYYYSSITKGDYEDLYLYYAPGVVKSLSIGGAHAFCKSRLDMDLQFKSLRGTLWDVTGAIAQDGFLESIVLHITGNAFPKTTTTPKTVIFSHSITLIKLAEGYQIRNDAMSLITTGL